MKDLWDMLDGYKTYIVMWVWILACVVEKVFGFDIPNFDPGPDWMNTVLVTFGVGAARSAVKKVEG